MSEFGGERTDVAGVDILHLDMDAFFCSVEMLADPTLRGRPVVVGGTGPRAVVASASYEARVFGVRSAMAMAEARRRCPNLVIIPGRYREYAAMSTRLLEICGAVTALVEPVALDEAYLDVAGAHALFGSSETIARVLRTRVHEELGLGCAVGIGRTKLIAKLASKAAKPEPGRHGPRGGRGIVVVDPSEEADFLARHEIRALPGVGPRTAARLVGLGVATVGDLEHLGRAQLVRIFGRAHGSLLADLGTGRDARRVVPDREARSIGREQTFPTDDRDRVSLEGRLRELAESVAHRCRESGLAACTVAIKIRFGDFTTLTRSRSPGWSLRGGKEIAEIACALLEPIEVHRGVRLLGVSLSGLQPATAGSGRQLALFDEPDDEEPRPGEVGRREEIDAATDGVRRRFGDDAIRQASGLRPTVGSS